MHGLAHVYREKYMDYSSSIKSNALDAAQHLFKMIQVEQNC
jgi:transposase InsO family protein